MIDKLTPTQAFQFANACITLHLTTSKLGEDSTIKESLAREYKLLDIINQVIAKLDGHPTHQDEAATMQEKALHISAIIQCIEHIKSAAMY